MWAVLHKGQTWVLEIFLWCFRWHVICITPIHVYNCTSGPWSDWKVQWTIIECTSMRTHACQTTCQCDHESCSIVSPHQGWHGAFCWLFIFGPAPKVWLVSLLPWLRAPAWDGAPIVKAERWKSALNFNWMESFALFHLQLSTEGQTDAREMQRRSAADRLQKTDALHCTYRVSTVHCAGFVSTVQCTTGYS